MGEKVLEYSDNFFFFMTTKFRNPLYLPDVCTKVTILNMMITEEGLND
jgi:dynein heavy chain